MFPQIISQNNLKAIILPNHLIEIDMNLGMITIDNIELSTIKKKRHFHRGYSKEENKGNKDSLFEWKYPYLGFVFQVNKGRDGRVFFHVYNAKDYSTFRKEPSKSYSFWYDKKTNKKLWYEENLYVPSEVS